MFLIKTGVLLLYITAQKEMFNYADWGPCPTPPLPHLYMQLSSFAEIVGEHVSNAALNHLLLTRVIFFIRTLLGQIVTKFMTR